MALVTMKSLLKNALENHYAVGYFESWNMESLLSVVDAAERTNSPVIIGFGGQFIGNPDRRVKENIYHYGSLGREAAERSSVPIALLLNESPDLSMLVRALKAGFNAVMHQDPESSFGETVRINQYLVRTAHYVGADVEAEVGELPSAKAGTHEVFGGEQTDPDQAAYFVRQTGIDALAVAIGNVHLLEGKKTSLDYDLIRRIREKVDIPLVMHGGTGLSRESIREAIELGICKINVGTVLKRTFINSIRSYFETQDTDLITAHDVVGRGGKEDFLAQARELMTQDVEQFIDMFGSRDKAKLF